MKCINILKAKISKKDLEITMIFLVKHAEINVLTKLIEQTTVDMFLIICNNLQYLKN